MINTELLLQEWNKIEEKAKEIVQACKDDLKWLDMVGNNDDISFCLEDEMIVCKSTSSYKYGRHEDHSFYIALDEINSSVGYFENKYREMVKDEKIREEQKKYFEDKIVEERERRKYEELKAKFEK